MRQKKISLAFALRHFLPQTTHPLFWLLTLILILPEPLEASEKIVINSGRKEPFTRTEGTGFYDILIKALFKRMGMEAETVRLPSERALINVNTGIDDGNVARIKGLEKKYPNLVRVPEKILDFEFMAYTVHADFKVTNWNSLAPYNVGFINGWKIFEKNIKQAKSITKVRSPAQLFTLLKNNRADVVMFDRWGGLWWIKEHNVNAHYLEPPITKREMYLYLHKKHTALVPRITQTLVDMKQDGEYQKIFDQTLTPLLRTNKQQP